MYFSKVVLFAISLCAISVLATPHALHYHALHRRAVAARVASAPSNPSEVTVKRQDSPKCNNRSPSSSSSHSTPAATPIVPNTPIVQNKTVVQNTPVVAHVVTTSTPPPAAPSTTSSTAAAPANTQPANTGGDNGPFTGGDGTFFATGLGACGFTNQDTDFIVAVSELRYDAAANGPNPNSNPLCGKKVSISYGGKTATATVVDRCTGCGYNSLDMSDGLFEEFALLAVGRIHNIVWYFL